MLRVLQIPLLLEYKAHTSPLPRSVGFLAVLYTNRLDLHFNIGTSGPFHEREPEIMHALWSAWQTWPSRSFSVTSANVPSLLVLWKSCVSVSPQQPRDFLLTNKSRAKYNLLVPGHVLYKKLTVVNQNLRTPFVSRARIVALSNSIFPRRALLPARVSSLPQRSFPGASGMHRQVNYRDAVVGKRGL